MRVFLRSAIVLFMSVAAFGQTNDPAMDQEVFDKPLRSSYIPLGPGDKMISVLDLDGAYVKSLTIGGLVTLQLANNTEVSVQLSGGGGGGGMADGVLVTATYNATTKMIDLTTSEPRSLPPLDLSALRNSTEIDAKIAAMIANWAKTSDTTTLIPDAKIPDGIARDSELPDVSTYLERSDIVAGSNVTLSPGTGNSVSIAATGDGTGTDDQTAAEVPVTASSFGGNLSNTDTDVQTALETIDGFTLGGGGGTGTDDQTATEVLTSTTNFGNNLGTGDTTVQAALDTLDDLTISGGTPLAVTTADIASITFTEGLTAEIDPAAINTAVDTGIAVPANTKTILVNYGASTDAATAGRDLLWFAMPIEEWERLDGVDVGDTPTQGNARFTRIWRDADITAVGAVMARQVWLGKGNNGNIFVWSDNTAWDIYPFRARFEIHTPLTVVTDVTGGGGGGGGGLSTVATADPISGDGSLTDPVALSGEVPDARIPAGIARDSELPTTEQLVPAGGVPGDTLKRVGTTGTEFSSPVGDGVVESGEVTGTTLTLRRTQSLADVTITGLPQAGEATNDGVVNTLAVAAQELTATRSEGLDPLRVTLPFEIILPDSTTGHLPLFAEADLERVSNDHGNICTVRREILNTGTLLSVTTEAYSATGYRGVRYAAPDVGLPQPNDTMFAYHNRRWYQWNAILQAWVITSGPSGWVGAWDTEDAAEHAVTAVGDTFYADDELPRRVQRVTAYTAPAAADVDYACLPEPAILSLQNRPLLPAPDSTNIGEFVEVNAAGDGYVTAAVALEEEIYAIPPDDITQVGDLITMANIPPLTDGLLLYFTAEGANTAGLTLSIEGTTYNVLKSAGASGAELFEGGEIENGLPLQLVYDNGEGTFYWFGTVLGSAARRDVGTEQNELVALNDNGRISSTLLGENPVVGYSLSFTATGPAWTEEVSGGGGGGDDAYDWATEGNDAILIPALKIPDLDAAKIVSGTFDRDRIPFDAGTVESFLESQITYTGSGTSLEFDGHGTGNAVFGSIKAFQYRAAFTASDSGLRASYNGDAFANIIIKASNGINRQMTLNDFTRYDYFLIQKASPNWVLVGGSVAASRHPDSYTNTLADNRIAPWARNFSPSGTAPTVRLGTGTAGTTTFLRGDGTWAAAGGGTTLDIAGLPNLPSFEISDLDVMVTEDVSDSNTQKHFTIGELADRLADGSSITATGGTLTAAAGGGGGDITAVTTAINSGLEGGDTDGDVALSLDVSNLQSYISTISSADHVALSDEGEAGDPTRRLSLNQLAHWQSLQDNGGIAATNGQSSTCRSTRRATLRDYSRVRIWHYAHAGIGRSRRYDHRAAVRGAVVVAAT